MKEMPAELLEFMFQQPNSMYNNSRQIIRDYWEKIKNKHCSQIEFALRKKWGLHIDMDYSDTDWGEPPQSAN